MYHDGSQDSCPTEGIFPFFLNRRLKWLSTFRLHHVSNKRHQRWNGMVPMQRPFPQKSQVNFHLPIPLNVFHTVCLRMSCLNDFPAAVIPTHDLTIFGTTPGQYYTSDEQCRLLLYDKKAIRDYRQALSVNTPITPKFWKWMNEIKPNQDICTSLRCLTPSRRGTFSSGPAVEGTTCGQGRWCRGGRCVPTTYGLQLPFSPPMDNQWWDEECKSGCVNRSIGKLSTYLSTRLGIEVKKINKYLGTKTSRRNCDEQCHSSTRTAFCDDEKVI